VNAPLTESSRSSSAGVAASNPTASMSKCPSIRPGPERVIVTWPPRARNTPVGRFGEPVTTSACMSAAGSPLSA
jgi:hypothetical protein